METHISAGSTRSNKQQIQASQYIKWFKGVGELKPVPWPRGAENKTQLRDKSTKRKRLNQEKQKRE